MPVPPHRGFGSAGRSRRWRRGSWRSWSACTTRRAPQYAAGAGDGAAERVAGREGLGASDLTPSVVAEVRRGAQEVGVSQSAVVERVRDAARLSAPGGRGAGAGSAGVPSPMTAEEELLDRYRRYLMRERGVCEQAADGYLRKVRRFLAWRASAGGAGLEGLTAADVSAFVLAECPGRSTHWGKALDAVAAVVPCVPARRWRAGGVVGGRGPAGRWLAAGGATAPVGSRRRSAARCGVATGRR